MSSSSNETHDRVERGDGLVMCRRCLSLVISSGLKLKGDERLLEVGSEGASFLPFLARSMKRGYAGSPDVSSMVSWDAGEMEKLTLDYPDGTFDLVVSSCPIFRVKDSNQYFKEIRRVLREGGRLAVVMQPSEVCEDMLLALRLVQKRYPDVFEGSAMEAAQCYLRTKEEVQRSISSSGFLVSGGSDLRYAERFTPVSYAGHVMAMAGESYLNEVPSPLREEVRQAFVVEASRLCGPGPTVRDCAVIVFATKV